MEILAVIIVVLIIILLPLILSINAINRTRKIPLLEQDINHLKSEIEGLKQKLSPMDVEEGDVTTPVPVEVLDKEVEVSDNPVEIEKDEIEEPIQTIELKKEASIEPVSIIEPENIGEIGEVPLEQEVITVRNKAPGSSFKWKWNQEKTFAFLGGFLGVIGLVFLVIYLGTKINILTRFIIMASFSVVFLGISFPLEKKKKWIELAHISRSLSGAILLFSVFASHAIDGFIWIVSPGNALIAISIGTIYNLFLCGICKKRIYIIFHMVINGLVIFLIPAQPQVLWLVLFLTLGLQVFTFIRKEILNTSLSLLFLTVYCIFYKYTGVEVAYLSWCYNVLGLLAFTITILLRGKQNKFTIFIDYALPLLWIGGSAFFAESVLSGVIPLVTGAIIGGVIKAGSGKNWKEILYWPFQMLIIGALLILANKNVPVYWLTVLYLETSIFTYWMIREKRNKILPIVVNFVLFAVIVVYTFFLENDDLTWFLSINRAFVIGSASLFLFFSRKHFEEETKDIQTFVSTFQFLLPVAAFLLSQQVTESPGILRVLFFVFLCGLILFISTPKDLSIRTKGLWLALSLLLVVVGFYFIEEANFTFIKSLGIISLLLFLSAVSLFYNKFRKVEIKPNLGVFLFSIILVATIYFPFIKVSTYLPGILTLLIAYIYLFWWEKWGEKEVQASCFIILFYFFFRFFTHHLQMENYLGLINLRLVSEILVFWVIYSFLKSNKWSLEKKSSGLNDFFHSTLFLCSWFFLLVFILSHSNRNILSVILQLSIILLLWIENKKFIKGYPLSLVAYCHFLLAQVNLALNTHPSFPFLPPLFQNPWIFGVVNVLASILIIFLFYRHFKKESYTVYPVFNNYNKIRDSIVKKRNLALLIPLFLSLGLFLNWTLEATALTVALFVCCFLLYGTALILRENVFRHGTSIALLGTTIRLVFWDLAQATILAKAIAFIGASVVFILINILYSHFKGRFEHA